MDRASESSDEIICLYVGRNPRTSDAQRAQGWPRLDAMEGRSDFAPASMRIARLHSTPKRLRRQRRWLSDGRRKFRGTRGGEDCRGFDGGLGSADRFGRKPRETCPEPGVSQRKRLESGIGNSGRLTGRGLESGRRTIKVHVTKIPRRGEAEARTQFSRFSPIWICLATASIELARTEVNFARCNSPAGASATVNRRRLTDHPTSDTIAGPSRPKSLPPRADGVSPAFGDRVQTNAVAAVASPGDSAGFRRRLPAAERADPPDRRRGAAGSWRGGQEPAGPRAQSHRLTGRP